MKIRRFFTLNISPKYTKGKKEGNRLTENAVNRI